MIDVMVVGLSTELGYKTALEVIKNHDTNLIKFTLGQNNGTIKVGETIINLVPPESHEMIIKEKRPDVIVDFTNEFEDVFQKNLKLYTKSNLSFVVGTILSYSDNLGINIDGSESSALVIDNVDKYDLDLLAEIAVNAAKFLFDNPEKGKIFEDDAVLDFE